MGAEVKSMDIKKTHQTSSENSVESKKKVQNLASRQEIYAEINTISRSLKNTLSGQKRLNNSRELKSLLEQANAIMPSTSPSSSPNRIRSNSATASANVERRREQISTATQNLRNVLRDLQLNERVTPERLENLESAIKNLSSLTPPITLKHNPHLEQLLNQANDFYRKHQRRSV